MSGLDGYLTALIIGPKFIDPRQWIPLLTGAEANSYPVIFAVTPLARAAISNRPGRKYDNDDHVEIAADERCVLTSAAPTEPALVGELRR